MTRFDFDEWYQSLDDEQREEYTQMCAELRKLQEELKKQNNNSKALS